MLLKKYIPFPQITQRTFNLEFRTNIKAKVLTLRNNIVISLYIEMKMA